MEGRGHVTVRKTLHYLKSSRPGVQKLIRRAYLSQIPIGKLSIRLETPKIGTIKDCISTSVGLGKFMFAI